MWRLAALGQVSGLDGYDDGLFWSWTGRSRVADMVTEELGGSGRVLDACAAPAERPFEWLRADLVVAVDL